MKILKFVFNAVSVLLFLCIVDIFFWMFPVTVLLWMLFGFHIDALILSSLGITFGMFVIFVIVFLFKSSRILYFKYKYQNIKTLYKKYFGK